MIFAPARCSWSRRIALRAVASARAVTLHVLTTYASASSLQGTLRHRPDFSNRVRIASVSYWFSRQPKV